MPVTIGQIASNTAAVTIRVGEETVTIVYYPGKVTEKAIAQMQGMAAMNESNVLTGFSAFNETLASLIKSWDVLENDGVTMYPLEAARLAELPVGFRVQVIGAIMEDLRPEAMAPQLNGAH